MTSLRVVFVEGQPGRSTRDQRADSVVACRNRSGRTRWPLAAAGARLTSCHVVSPVNVYRSHVTVRAAAAVPLASILMPSASVEGPEAEGEAGIGGRELRRHRAVPRREDSRASERAIERATETRASER